MCECVKSRLEAPNPVFIQTLVNTSFRTLENTAIKNFFQTNFMKSLKLNQKFINNCIKNTHIKEKLENTPKMN